MEGAPPGHVILTVPEVEALDRANTPSRAPLLGGNTTSSQQQVVNAVESDFSEDEDGNDDNTITAYETASTAQRFMSDGYHASDKTGYDGKTILRQPPSWAWCAIGLSLVVSLVLFISGAIMFSQVKTSMSKDQSAEGLINGAVVDPIIPSNKDTIGKNAVGTKPSISLPGDKSKTNDTAEEGEDLFDIITNKRYTLDDYLSGTLSPGYKSIHWLETPQDGIIVTREAGHIDVEMLHDGTSRILANTTDLIDPDGRTMAYAPYSISADLQYIMFTTNVKQEWRHSSFAEYIIYEVATRRVTRLTETGGRATTSYAKWSPMGHSVMFVRGNDLYVNVDLKLEIRVTYDGSATVFNGIPDWIYEEEVFTSNFVCWWSPNAQHVAFLRLDETNVPEYNMTMYAEKTPRENSYPTEVKIRYPKPGYPNPIATLHVYSLKSPAPTKHDPVAPMEFKRKNAFTDEDRLIVEVAWMGDDQLMVRTMNRVQDIAQLYLVDATKLSATFVREEQGNVDGGWLDIKQALAYIPAGEGTQEGYIDLVVHDGNDHLAYFSSLTADKPSYWLTHGDWEVVDGAAGIDLIYRRVFYMSTERGSTQRHLYSVSLDGTNKQALTPDDGGVYEVKFSPHAGWYTLSYRGPNIPSQKLYSTHDPKFERTLKDFTPLKEAAARYKLPTIRFKAVKSAGYDLNVKEYVPPDFDENKKYGVLFRVYGGPGSQLVTRAFSPGFDDVVASDPTLNMIVVIVDNRGTGFKGRKFRVGVRKQLGTLETIDQINAGRAWSKLPYVDPTRIAIWGWSYGGYMAAKVIEANSKVFQAGVSVAPVTNWHYYDSIYTERYMLTPQNNPDGYEDTGIRDPDGFRNARYLVIHGTGDDNVHFQQTAHLVNMLTESNVDPSQYEVQFYTDNNHSMGQHGAYFIIWKRILTFLKRALPLKVANS